MRCLAGPWLIGCALAWPALAVAQGPIFERECGIMQRMGSMVEGVPAPWLHVLNRRAQDGPITLPVGTVSVGCVRDSVVPGPNDDQIPLLGVPLTLSEEGARRSIFLRLDNGRFVYQVVQGTLSDAQRESVERRIAEFQARRQTPTR